jgi:predicted Zn finger-like uncharacterized protein
MEVRCSSCNKLFRVSDDKITGSGIKFNCSRCGTTVKITREDFEQYKVSHAAAAPVPFDPKPAAPVSAPPPRIEATSKTTAPSVALSDFDLSAPADAAAAMQQEREPEPDFLQPPPSIKAEQSPPPAEAAPKKEAVAAPRVEQKTTLQPKTEAARTSPSPAPKPADTAPPAFVPIAPAPPKTPPAPKSPAATTAPKAAPASAAPAPPAEAPARESPRPGPLVLDTAPQQDSSGFGKKAILVIIALMILGGAAVGTNYYLGKTSQQTTDPANATSSVPEGLQILNASGAVDPANGDLIVTGVIENSSDQPKPAWYVVVDVYDAQGAVLTKGKLFSGKQLYLRRDYELMVKRGINIQELQQKLLQEQGIVIPAKGTVNFEIRVMEPPVGIASFNATLQPFDPVQLFKEMAEEQK